MNDMQNKQKLTGYASIDKPQNIGATFFEKNPIIPNTNIYNTIKILSKFYRNEIAIDCMDLNVSYQEILNDALTISLALKELGVRAGDIITVSMPNFYQAVATFLACNRIGAITTFLNSFASTQEINYYLNLFESPIFINYDKSIEENVKIKANTKLKHIITLNKKNVNLGNIYNDYHETSDGITIDFNSLGSISKFQKMKIEKAHSLNEDALILFTSGTTGNPKSVVLTNKNILASGIYLKNSSHIKKNGDKKTLVCVPFTYPYGFGTSTLMTLLSNKTAILAPNISKDTISYYLKKEPNIIFGSPALLELIMKNTPKAQNLSSISTFISGGDFLTPANSERGKKFFEQHGANVKIGNGSGNAETVSCGTNPVGIDIRPETAGKVLVGTDVMIIDPNTMEEKKYNEEGLLCVSGKHVFKEYYKEPKLTKEAKFIKNGKEYFKTGTMGFIDQDGYFTLTGRQSRFYIMSTLNKVYCDHIQNIVSQLDCIQECAIVKVPDNDKLFVNKAYIVLNDGVENIYQDQIMELLNKPVITNNGDVLQLKDYEIPTYFEFVNHLPRKAGTEKIDYQLLENDALEKLQNNKKLTLKK